MTGGLRYLPAPRRGRRRVGLIALGLMAAMSLVWQQQATLASFIDSEHTGATFTAATLSAITPKPVPGVTKVDIDWPAASGTWATRAYRLDVSPSPSGTGTNLYSGGATSYSQASSGPPGTRGLNFTDVAAGASHACGIAQGRLYCWGTSASGGLGLGTPTFAAVPTLVNGGALGAKLVTQVTAGGGFTCAIAEGKAYCWGLGTSGQLGNGGQTSSSTPVAVSNLTGVTSVSAGTAHACAMASGKAYCWGDGAYGQIGDGAGSRKELPTLVKTDGVLNGRTVSAIAAGGSQTCAVADGRAFCWGLNSSGQLGDGTLNSQGTPVAVDVSTVLMGRVVSGISAGATHTCAIADGAAYCWGNNSNGQLATGATSTTPVKSPVAVTTLPATVATLSAGLATTCAVAGDKAYCWGSRAGYGTGDGSNSSNQTTPAALGASLDGLKASDISVGTSFGCAVADNNPASCWGLGANYQQGNNSVADNKTPGNVTVSGIACPDLSVRISDTACTLPQGTDFFYRLGYSIGTWTAPKSDWVQTTTKVRAKVNPTASAQTNTSITLAWSEADQAAQSYPEYTLERSLAADGTDPVHLATTGSRSWVDNGGVAPTRKFTAITSGGSHTCGIVAGDLYCWGFNGAGQLGVGDTNSRSVPTLVGGPLSGKTVTAVAAGDSHTCAIAEGLAYCWGLNSSGQLGSVTSTSSTPVAVNTSGALAGKAVTAISGGFGHSCAVASGQAYCWGSNAAGQLGDGTTVNRATPVAVSPGAMGVKPVTSVGAGGSHSCAVAAGGAYCWGSNKDGQLGIGKTPNSSVLPVAVSTAAELLGRVVSTVTAGASHTCVIADQHGYCWGDDSSGQLGNNKKALDRSVPVAVNTTVMGGTVTAISAGTLHTCAVSTGSVYCWGENGNSQLGRGATSTTDAGMPVLVSASGALASANATAVGAGGAHSCMVSDGTAYCWGLGATGRLGDGTNDNSMFPRATVGNARCASGSVSLGNGTCSLAPGRTYYYRITYTLDGRTQTSGSWTDLTTG